MLQMLDNLNDPADHLALDEAVLMREAAESDRFQPWEILRVWEFSQPVVVAGRSSRIRQEIDVDYCHAMKMPILRRCTGGASVVAGPGCLMYSVVLDHAVHDGLRKIDAAHQYVMSRVLAAVQQQVPAANLQGICDLTWQNRKCSGNSLRVTRDRILYHGTVLYDFDLTMLSRCLLKAPRQPDYRVGRDHSDFVTNVPLNSTKLAEHLVDMFEVRDRVDAALLQSEIMLLRKQRYDLQQWHFRIE
ncbi:lipoate--protein ligase family protein [Rubripirellula sp.]|nr:lipoate--protein ligase family protein [Rubripirellula sp.]